MSTKASLARLKRKSQKKSTSHAHLGQEKAQKLQQEEKGRSDFCAAPSRNNKKKNDRENMRIDEAKNRKRGLLRPEPSASAETMTVLPTLEQARRLESGERERR